MKVEIHLQLLVQIQMVQLFTEQITGGNITEQ